MKDYLKIFESEKFGKIRIFVKENGDITLNLLDICMALGYTKNNAIGKIYLRKDLIENICEALDISGVSASDTLIKITKEINFDETYISEDAFYDLCLESRVKHAREFRKWITVDVLPTLRKHGAYILDDENVDEAYIKNEYRFSQKRTIKTFSACSASGIKELYDEFKKYVDIEYKNKTDERVARYKSVEKGLTLLHDTLAKDPSNIGDCYNVRKTIQLVIVDRTTLEKRISGGEKAGMVRKISKLTDELKNIKNNEEDIVE